MIWPPTRFALAMAIALSTVAIARNLAAEPLTGDWSTKIEAQEAQPADAPVLVWITVTNDGQAPIRYWSGGPGKYPDARQFSARVTDEKGKSRDATLSNGQYQMGSGINYKIQPGQSVTLPAALDPLPPGSYTIQVGTEKGPKGSG